MIAFVFYAPDITCLKEINGIVFRNTPSQLVILLPMCTNSRNNRIKTSPRNIADRKKTLQVRNINGPSGISCPKAQCRQSAHLIEQSILSILSLNAVQCIFNTQYLMFFNLHDF